MNKNFLLNQLKKQRKIKRNKNEIQRNNKNEQ